MGQTFIEFFSSSEFYDIWPRNELPKVYFIVVNHIGYFIEQKTDLRFGDQLSYFLTHWGNHRIQGTVLARHEGVNRAQIFSNS